MKKIVSLSLVISTLMATLVGCGSQQSANEKEENDAPKVAVILEGPISDMSWNATAYNGLLMIEELGAEIYYQESVPVSSLADSINTYANSGIDLIYLSTTSYADVGFDLAPEYPDTKFVLINGDESKDNLTTIAVSDAEQGFMLGVISALLTQTNKVGFVGGLEIFPIVNAAKGFEQGVAFIDDKVEAVTVMAGSFDDVNKAKELTKALIQSGVDVVSPVADQAGLGVVEAAEELETKALASGVGFESQAENYLQISVMKDTSIAYVAAYQQYIEGQLSSDEIQVFGAADGVVYLSEWYNDDDVSDDVKQQINDIYKALVAGDIEISLD